jgi:hypothetical protein
VNNIIVGTRMGISMDPAANGAVVTHNAFFNNTSHYLGNIDPSKNFVNVDPMFKNPGNDDYHLLPNSTLIDVGTTGVPWLRTDLDTNPRVLLGKASGQPGIDVGAYESTDLALSLQMPWKRGFNVILSFKAPANQVGVVLMSRGSDSLFVPGIGTLLLSPSGLLPFVFSVAPTPGLIGLGLPNDPALDCVPIWIQGFAIDLLLNVKPTNELFERF